MTDDLVERLREDARGGYAYHELSDEAADEIERLRDDLTMARADWNRTIDLKNELLALLKTINEYWEGGNFSREPKLWQRIRATIAKIEGAIK
jgi:hypothetical protein